MTNEQIIRGAFSQLRNGKAMITIRNTNEKFGDRTEFTGATLAEAVAEFQDCVTELDYGTVTESDYEIQFSFATDSETGVIYAPTFDAAREQLENMVKRVIDDGAWGWVEDIDGTRYEIGQ